jgi:transcriptional regulator with XRE-family HTH domain
MLETSMDARRERLKEARQARGLTQRELARALQDASKALGKARNVDANTVSRWERGAIPVSEPCAELLAAVLGMNRAALRLPPSPVAAQIDHLRDVRIPPETVDHNLMDLLEGLTNRYARQRNISDSATVLPMVISHLATLRDLIAGRPRNDQVGLRLRELLGLTAWLAGQLMWTARRRRSPALDYAHESQTVARAAGSRRVLALALLLESHWYSAMLNSQRQARPERALKLLTEAASQAPPGLVQAEVRIYLAQELAHSRKEAAWRSEIETVAAIISHAGGDPVFDYFDENIPKIFEARCYHVQGNAMEAAKLFLSAHDGLKRRLLVPGTRTAEPETPLNPCMLYAQLAAASADLGEAEQACKLMVAAIELAPDMLSLDQISRYRDTHLLRHRRLDLQQLNQELNLAVARGSGRQALKYRVRPTATLDALDRRLS